MLLLCGTRVTDSKKSGIQTLTFPMARRPLSKNNIIPRNEKNIPNPVSPNPISVSEIKESKRI